ncbi:hypothetical protein Nepgr_010866 [Nepenthes gracilis]|uniref:Uncharacterized protein n=1 Tax=Nepenthes gracilis TaxID=150966 RepID=A0AAD3SE18_NEPGR|nr:hypothetical protein Nepgr_010866 [Nepenthes gracilis]
MNGCESLEGAIIKFSSLDSPKLGLLIEGVCGCDRFTNGSIRDVTKTIIKDGYRGLMRGWVPRMLFHAPAASICRSTYEAGKAFFQQLNESHGRS